MGEREGGKERRRREGEGERGVGERENKDGGQKEVRNISSV